MIHPLGMRLRKCFKERSELAIFGWSLANRGPNGVLLSWIEVSEGEGRADAVRTLKFRHVNGFRDETRVVGLPAQGPDTLYPASFGHLQTGSSEADSAFDFVWTEQRGDRPSTVRMTPGISCPAPESEP